MNKKILLLFLFFLAFFPFMAKATDYEHKNEESGYSIIVKDNANIFSNADISVLYKKMEPLTNGGNAVFITMYTGIDYDTTENEAFNYYQDYSYDSNIVVVFSFGRDANAPEGTDFNQYSNIFIFCSEQYKPYISENNRVSIVWSSLPVMRNGNPKDAAFTVFDNLADINHDNYDAIDAIEKINKNSKYKMLLQDDANLLSDDEEAKLVEDMAPLLEYGNIAFLSIKSNPNRSTSLYASRFYHNIFHAESGTLFLIDMDQREIYIFSDGSNYNTITKSKAYSITDNVYQYASREQYYECASVAFKQINTLLAGGKILEPMRYTSLIFISLTISFFITFLYVLAKTKIKPASDRELLKNCNVDFKIGETYAKKTGSHSVYSPISDSSGSDSFGGGGGGFSSGGGGGGGSSSGGGGGHSF